MPSKGVEAGCTRLQCPDQQVRLAVKYHIHEVLVFNEEPSICSKRGSAEGMLPRHERQ